MPPPPLQVVVFPPVAAFGQSGSLLARYFAPNCFQNSHRSFFLYRSAFTSGLCRRLSAHDVPVDKKSSTQPLRHQFSNKTRTPSTPPPRPTANSSPVLGM